MKNIILISLFCFSFGFGATYHVAANGSDANPGTQALPWLTPMHARYIALNPGDSVLLKRGDVFEGNYEDTLIGTWANPIVIGAYGSGARPIIYGDLRGRTWVKSWMGGNIYQCYVGAGSDFQNGFKQYYNGAWVNSSSTNYRNAFPAEWFLPGNFFSSMVAGTFGISTDDDTIFVHLYGDAAGVGHDSLRCYRYAGVQIVTGSKGYYIRDLDCRDNYLGVLSWGDSARIRNIHTQMSITDGMAFQYGSNSLCDSCRIDTTGDTGFYFVQALRCKLATTVITNTGLATVDGIPSGGIDRAGIGILDHHNASQTGYGYNTIDSNTVYNDFSGTLDFFYCIGDTFRYNVSHAAGGGAFPAGNNLVLSHNSFTMKPTGANGMNVGQYRNGNISITYNLLDSVKDYGIQISENDSTGTFTLNHNTIRLTIPARTFMNYETFNPSITSTNNDFHGSGDVFTNGVTNYSTLTAFQAATSNEVGSTLNQSTQNSTLSIRYANNRTGVITTALDSVLTVFVGDSLGLPVTNYTIAWSVTASPANSSWTYSTTTTTDVYGFAYFTISKLPQHAGTITIQASGASLTGSPVTFTETIIKPTLSGTAYPVITHK